MFRITRNYVTRREFAALSERITNMEASQQGQIDAITAELTTVENDLDAGRARLQAEIDSIQGGKPANLAALQAVADTLDPAVQKIGALTPTPPAPA